MSTKIVVCVRTRDEEARIGGYCEAWKGADKILVADGGSVDKTKEIASQYPNVEIRDFTQRTILQNGYWRNNDSNHANFLFAWAHEYSPDWIIYEDADVRPNELLRAGYRNIMEFVDADYLLCVHFYLWGLDKHFPNLSKCNESHDQWCPCVFAFRGNQDFWTIDVPPAYDFRIGGRKVLDLHKDAKAFDIMPPYAMLHYAWDDPAKVRMKVKMYRESGFIPGMQHPLEFGGPLEDLPNYLHE